MINDSHWITGSWFETGTYIHNVTGLNMIHIIKFVFNGHTINLIYKTPVTILFIIQIGLKDNQDDTNVEKLIINGQDACAVLPKDPNRISNHENDM